ncbi:MAG: M56 family metallopeptidase [Pirellulaceae bacterium]
MLASLDIQSILVTHILQFSIVITLCAALIALAGRRFPHFAFLICMLALAKCLVPPLITSPAGIFTRYSSLAFSPQFRTMNSSELIHLKQTEFTEHNTFGTSVYERRESAVNIEPAFEGWMLAVLFIWMLGVLAIAILAGSQYARLRALIRKSRKAPAPIQALANSLQLQLDFRRPVSVLISDENFGPACVGFFRPKLIIPCSISAWSERLMSPVLAHELVHARRGDIAWGVVQFVAQAVWWFHPLVWWLGRRASLICERCCDEEVVASTHCSAGDYAESLVRVLEMRSEFHSVPLCHAMSPSQITSQRLERLMKRYGKFSKRTSRMGWALTIVLAAILIPGMKWAVAQDEKQKPSSAEVVRQQETEYRTQVNQAIQAGEWSKAIRLLEPIVQKDPTNGDAIFYLGYALHANGQVEQALEYHKLAADFPKTKAIALYNWACALALQGEVQGALEKLTEALDAGFVHQEQLSDDPDLAVLVDTDEFKALEARMNSHRSEFDFWIGRWEVRDADGKSVGSNVITSSERGRVITEKWVSAGGGTGTSINFFHPGKKKWTQVWVDDKGATIELVGGFRNGKMEFVGESFAVNGQTSQCRMVLTPNSNGTVDQLIESSQDGQSWQVAFRGTYHPQEATVAVTLQLDQGNDWQLWRGKAVIIAGVRACEILNTFATTEPVLK